MEAGLLRVGVVLMSAVVMGGCLGGAQPAATEPLAPAQDAPPAASAAQDAVADATANATAPPRVEPFAWDGRVSNGICVPSGPNSCNGPPQTTDEFRHAFAAPLPSAASLDLTWEAGPGMEDLVFTLAIETTCGAECTSWTDLAMDEGTSPLHIEAAAIAISSEATLALRVATASRTPSPAYALVNLEQPFHVEGTLTFA